MNTPRASSSKNTSAFTRSSAAARSSALRMAPATGCIVISEPRPVNCSATPRLASSSFRRSRRASPRSFSACRRPAVSTCVSPAMPAAMVSTLLLKVPACCRAPLARGSKRCSRSARPPKAPKDSPPPKYLPSVVRSGLSPSSACRPPKDRRDVITSSRISSAPVSSASARSPSRKAGSPGMQPPEPSKGSTRMAASSPRCGATRACTSSRSL